MGGGAGVLRGHQGGRVSAGEERVLGVGRSGDPAPSFGPLLPFAFLFLPPLRLDVSVQRNWEAVKRRTSTAEQEPR